MRYTYRYSTYRALEGRFVMNLLTRVFVLDSFNRLGSTPWWCLRVRLTRGAYILGRSQMGIPPVRRHKGTQVLDYFIVRVDGYPKSWWGW